MARKCASRGVLNAIETATVWWEVRREGSLYAALMARAPRPRGLAAKPVRPADSARFTAACGQYARKHCSDPGLATAQAGRMNRACATRFPRGIAAAGETPPMVWPTAVPLITAPPSTVLATTVHVTTALVRTGPEADRARV